MKKLTFNERLLGDLRSIQSGINSGLDSGKAAVDRVVTAVGAQVAKEKAQARKLWRRPGVRAALVILGGIVLLGLGAVLSLSG